ncbi:HAMP domain-containing sensor histidine kinase [Bacteroides sp. 224]|uniref:sensor histidine kinase n=1 Tax=Bacteroides sp. 224 TaxID=2302936 RepID=UPI0013D1E7C3|nr:HAMP domain-containing sensor histidine kinase [Bacteroides sp. 224]NDV65140.1 sensor histidine kinase [Bacteroides sp. 224]
MKLLHYTYRSLSLFLLLLMTIWGIFFYFTILEEVTDETDDSLENYRDILVNTALKDPSVLDTSGNVMTMYEFRSISKEAAAHHREKFYDSTVYIEVEDEDEPVRVMETSFMMPDGQYYELKIMISTLEREDMIEAILGYLLSLYVLLLICIIVVNRVVLKRSFLPLDRLLNWLGQVQPGKEVPPLDNETQIQEFKKLNEAAIALSNRSYNAYIEQKQFIENASHELQTPLAIVRGKIELLAESESLTEEQMKELDDIYNTLGRAVKLNKSLLLLSRIENKQYAEVEDVCVNDVVNAILPDLMLIYESRNIQLDCHEEDKFMIRCNASLARILIANLLKNALVHNIENGELHLLISHHSLVIKNSGKESLDPDRIFQRFYHTQTEKKDSTGLGLAIARSIASSCGLTLQYSWENEMHCFLLS